MYKDRNIFNWRVFLFVFLFFVFFVLAQLINNHQLSFCLAVEMGLIYARNIVS